MFLCKASLTSISQGEHWTGSFLKAAWLCQTGLEIHLGHGGFECPSAGTVDVSGCHARSDNGDVLAQDEFDSADIELDNDGSDGGSSCGMMIHAWMITPASWVMAKALVCIVDVGGLMYHMTAVC